MRFWLSDGDGFGWALDSDRKTFLEAFIKVGWIYSNKESADILVYVWPGALLRENDLNQLSKKIIICGLDNPVMIWGETIGFYEKSQMVDYFVCRNFSQIDEISSLGMHYFYIPYIMNQKYESINFNLPFNEKFSYGNHMRDSSELHGNKWILKKQKNSFLLAKLAKEFHAESDLVLAGVRRHALLEYLNKNDIPYKYTGNSFLHDKDDIFTENRLNIEGVSQYIKKLNLFVVTSRWEGGPYGVIEALFSGVPALSMNVGFYPDITPRQFICQNYGELRHSFRLLSKSIFACQDLFENQFLNYKKLDVFSYGVDPTSKLKKGTRQKVTISKTIKPTFFEKIKSQVRSRVSPKTLIRLKSTFLRKNINFPEKFIFAGSLITDKKYTVSILREFYKPPFGGGNQFLIGLANKFEELGITVFNNTVDESITHYIIDSGWLDPHVESQLRRLKMKSANQIRVLHRIDGAIGIYRGTDNGEDKKISNLNKEFADLTILQSLFSWVSTNSINSFFNNPIIVRNGAADIFHQFSNHEKFFEQNKKIKIVASAWSPNPKKGGPFYERLVQSLPDKYDFTFIGNIDIKSKNLNVISPLGPYDLAVELSKHDLYVTASELDSCSNSVLEALAVGLPVAYIDSGGHSEIVGHSGFKFKNINDFLEGLSRYDFSNHAYYIDQQETMEVVAKKYASVLFGRRWP